MRFDIRRLAIPAVALLVAFVVFASSCGRETGKPGYATYIVRRPLGGKTTYVETLYGVESTALNVFYEKADEIDLRPQRFKEEFDVQVEGDVNIAFRAHIVVAVRPDRAQEVIEKLGANFYEAKIQKPFRERVRAEVSKFKVFEVKDRRDAIAAAILARLREEFREEPFFVLDVLTGNIDYDVRVKDSALRAMIKKEELNQREIELQIQAKDNAIREVEAEGIREAQSIIRGSLTRRYNKWSGLQAIAELAGYADELTAEPKTPENTLFIFMPLGASGQLSLILDGDLLKTMRPAVLQAPRPTRRR